MARPPADIRDLSTDEVQRLAGRSSRLVLAMAKELERLRVVEVRASDLLKAIAHAALEDKMPPTVRMLTIALREVVPVEPGSPPAG